MTQKICNHCNQSFPATSEYYSPRSQGKYLCNTCKTCYPIRYPQLPRAERNRRRGVRGLPPLHTYQYKRPYKKHERTLEKNRERTSEVRARLQQIKLDTGCKDCGYKVHAEALHFDHLPGTVKLFSIASAPGKRWERIEAEMAKCEIVCANCHAVRTAKRKEQKHERAALDKAS